MALLNDEFMESFPYISIIQNTRIRNQNRHCTCV